jgi:hypothetical protein
VNNGAVDKPFGRLVPTGNQFRNFTLTQATPSVVGGVEVACLH